MNRRHILTCEYPPDVGGVADYTRHIAEALAGSGEEVHVWCPATRERREASGVHVHPGLGRFRPADLRRLSVRLDEFPAPRRILVQWVPHGFGYRSMNLWFCLWLAQRAMAGDGVELMVHEPFMELKRGPVRHVLMALVHRLMTLVLMQSATRAWVAIPAWEPLLRPYTLRRQIRIEWLPIPGCVSSQACAPVSPIRARYAEGPQPLIGHFGSHGREVTALLEERLVRIMDCSAKPALLLIGLGGDAFRATLASRHPTWADRVHATDYVAAAEVASYLDACDILLQPYPDGITSRRTSAMACLSQGRPVVTTCGPLTEPLWKESGAVVLADVSDTAGFASAVVGLIDDPGERKRIARQGQCLYRERFTVDHVVTALRAA